MRAVLMIGGAPRIRIDAVRHLTVAASGETAVALHRHCQAAGLASELLLGRDAAPGVEAARYSGREDLDAAVRAWLERWPSGVVVCSAAVNDYRFAGARLRREGRWEDLPAEAKIPSGAEALELRLLPAAKLVDALPGWGHRGPLVVFKYEEAGTVRGSARALLERTGAALAVANSLCGTVQALLGPAGTIEDFPDRSGLLTALGARLVGLAGD